MRTISIDQDSFIHDSENQRFIILRSDQVDDNAAYLESVVLPSLKDHQNGYKMPGVWGTLGYADDEKTIDWEGIIKCSRNGNQDFSEGSSVYEEVRILMDAHDELSDSKQVIEKVVNLTDLSIPIPDAFSLEELPGLRLTVFLKENEGALAFYQSKVENTEDAELTFIQPQATPGNTTNRDRLTYKFSMLPDRMLEEIPGIPGRFQLSHIKNHEDFIVKVLIFKRLPDNHTTSMLTSDSIVGDIEEKLAEKSDHLLAKRHRLLVFDPSKAHKKRKAFRVAETGTISPNDRTLLLIHGTFASTKGSFGEVYDWIRELMKDGDYGQVIAFDHPTLFYDAKGNIDVLFELLDQIGFQSFNKPVDIIGTSQGGLIAQCLANMDQIRIRVGKVSLVASANGVDYLRLGKGITTGLKLLRKVLFRTGAAPAAMVTVVLEHSADWLLRQPGIQLMTPGHEKLESIIYDTPNDETTRYLPIAGNHSSKKFFGRNLEKGIDKILDDHNDWVVGTKNQFKVPANYCVINGYSPGKYRYFMLSTYDKKRPEDNETALHGNLIEMDEAQERIERFFSGQYEDTLQIEPWLITDRFDAHCHIFGRNVISGRLVLMLLADLKSYLSDTVPGQELDDVTLRKKLEDNSDFMRIASNIFNYFLANKGGLEMLHDLEEAYLDNNADTYRYIPLMFDLEMSFRNKYDEDDGQQKFQELLSDFKKETDHFSSIIDRALNLFGESSLRPKTIKRLKQIRQVLKVIDLTPEGLSSGQKNSYEIQKKELRQLKVQYGNDLFPMIATDPRKPGMAQDIAKLVGRNKDFHGIKLYTPNGYSPTDPHFFDKEKKFIADTSLYQWCIDKNVPVMAHNSDAGFATFARNLEVYGDICSQVEGTNPPEYRLDFKDKELIQFNNNFYPEGLGEAIKERAIRLNHPRIWEKVLHKYKKLTICLAHMGGGNKDWQHEIEGLILKYDNVYTDLSCQTDIKRLEYIRDCYFREDTPENKKIRSRIMYGSDYFLNMLQDITFEKYYEQFVQVFGSKDLKIMSTEVPKSYLGL